MIQEILLTIVFGVGLAVVSLNLLAFVMFILCKSVDFLYSGTLKRICIIAKNILNKMWDICFFPAKWFFERI